MFYVHAVYTVLLSSSLRPRFVRHLCVNLLSKGGARAGVARAMDEGADTGDSTARSTAASLRVRQRFSGFYDLKVRHGANEHDIDSSHFNSESYVQSVSATALC